MFYPFITLHVFNGAFWLQYFNKCFLSTVLSVWARIASTNEKKNTDTAWPWRGFGHWIYSALIDSVCISNGWNCIVYIFLACIQETVDYVQFQPFAKQW